MATVLITNITQRGPFPPPGSNADVLVQFQVVGVRSDTDVVEVYAIGVSDSIGSGTPLDRVDINLTDSDYASIIQLAAGSFFHIYLCPRTKDKDGTLNNYYEGQYWENACLFKDFTTKAQQDPIPKPKPPAPLIGLIEPHQATLHNEGNIVVHWTATTNFDQYHFMWMENSQGWAEAEIDSGGTSGFFTVAPTFPGREYSFKVQGCITHMIGLNECSEFTLPTNIVMPQNTHSLREFLRLSNVQLNPGIRSLGPTAYSLGIRAMMRL